MPPYISKPVPVMEPCPKCGGTLRAIAIFEEKYEEIMLVCGCGYEVFEDLD